VSYVTRDAADDNEIERRMQMRSTFEHNHRAKFWLPKDSRKRRM